MSSDSYGNRQNPSAQLQLPDLVVLPGGKPVEMKFYGRKMALTSLDSVERLVSYSQKHLHKKYPDDSERIEHIWQCIVMVICDHCPFDDRRTYSLGMLNELTALAGVVISDQTRRHWYNSSYPGIDKNE